MGEKKSTISLIPQKELAHFQVNFFFFFFFNLTFLLLSWYSCSDQQTLQTQLFKIKPWSFYSKGWKETQDSPFIYFSFCILLWSSLENEYSAILEKNPFLFFSARKVQAFWGETYFPVFNLTTYLKFWICRYNFIVL